MGWISLKIEAHDNNADQLSDALMELGALSAIIEDANAETPDEQPIFGEPGDPPPGIWQQNVVSALFDEDADIAGVLAELRTATGLEELIYSTETIAEQDWVRATQSQFEPIRIRDDLWIVPSWHDAPNAKALNIVLDPGLAFGTGSHPTTHLCLAWLADTIKTGETVLDYGCGSGILAIAASKLGAAQVIGVDIDAQAIQSSEYNATQNHVIADFFMADKLPSAQFDVVVANILSSALSVLAPALASASKSGGRIALSGILREQTEQVSAIYAEWFDMNPPTFMDSWVLLTGIRR
ncbi:50S ribosomal protein L11 methyltransferase [Methylobacillus gramineus]|uniref:50S ribosomal protein L11 methyltransferase n=1 Tax=Methylobacillus gramineus TaxID=755169 RepID=UPI001CFFDC48|nr:50S ribosomal protein L11 methyltransferase [Methylobacillus gramineus]MCB5185690.1 50S ribosomal protein L11 methyltransferase [Methylobacillus gramineus]